jgi:hypothetical protein
MTAMPVVAIYALSWLGLMILAIVNGALRAKLYGPAMPELRAHQLSTFSALILFTLYLWLLNQLWPLEAARQALAIGGMWLGMTVAFEFIFGHYVMGNSWQILLHDYNLVRGRLWGFILVWTMVAPYACYRVAS